MGLRDRIIGVMQEIYLQNCNHTNNFYSYYWAFVKTFVSTDAIKNAPLMKKIS